MKAFAYLIPTLVLLAIGYVAGRWGARRGGLDRADRKELEGLRDLRFWLISETAKHQLLGDDFAFIVGRRLDEYFGRTNKEDRDH